MTDIAPEHLIAIYRGRGLTEKDAKRLAEEKQAPLPYAIERMARNLCAAACGTPPTKLIQCEFDPSFCPYWRNRLHLAPAALLTVGITPLTIKFEKPKPTQPAGEPSSEIPL